MAYLTHFSVRCDIGQTCTPGNNPTNVRGKAKADEIAVKYRGYVLSAENTGNSRVYRFVFLHRNLQCFGFPDK